MTPVDELLETAGIIRDRKGRLRFRHTGADRAGTAHEDTQEREDARK